MTQIFLASTSLTVATMAAAIDEGRFDEGRPQSRVLVLYSSAYAPETQPALDESPGFGALLKRFDEVLSWNDLIYPYHAHEWSPHSDDALLLQRLLREHWGLGTEDPALVVEAIQVNPALALAALFPDSPLHVVSDGLMTYGPTRNRLPMSVGTRVEQLMHVDLVPGLTPVLLSEFRVPSRCVDPAPLRAVLAEVAAECAPLVEDELRGLRGAASVVLGQYLSALGVLSEAEEARLHHDLLVRTGRVRQGPVIFKPHPAAAPTSVRRLVEGAREAGVTVKVSTAPAPAEVLYDTLLPTLVSTCFSTGAATAAQLYGLTAASYGADVVLGRLAPYPNSNRIPATVVHALLPRLTSEGISEPYVAPGQVSGEGQRLVSAVAYCMQPTLYPWLREDAESLVRQQGEEAARPYIGRDQVLLLGLFGAGRPLMRVASTSYRLAARARRVGGRLARRLSRERTAGPPSGAGGWPGSSRRNAPEGARPGPRSRE
ncbi:MAG: polysialyltransferase family glycosyltransferase [Actinomycetes bacterium]